MVATWGGECRVGRRYGEERGEGVRTEEDMVGFRLRWSAVDFQKIRGFLIILIGH